MLVDMDNQNISFDDQFLVAPSERTETISVVEENIKEECHKNDSEILAPLEHGSVDDDDALMYHSPSVELKQEQEKQNEIIISEVFSTSSSVKDLLYSGKP